MAICHELAHCGGALQWFSFQDSFIAFNKVEKSWFDYEVAAIDPALGSLRLLLECSDSIAIERQFTEARHRMHSGYCHKFAVALVEAQKRVDIDIRHSIAIGQQAGLIADIRPQPAHPPAGHGFQTRIHQRYAPIHPRRCVMIDTVTVRQIYRKVGIELIKIKEVFLDYISLVTKRQKKILMPEMRVGAQDVPQYGMPADWNHRFGQRIGILRETGSETASQNDNFHAGISQL